MCETPMIGADGITVSLCYLFSPFTVSTTGKGVAEGALLKNIGTKMGWGKTLMLRSID